jgi:hypothetical protein
VLQPQPVAAVLFFVVIVEMILRFVFQIISPLRFRRNTAFLDLGGATAGTSDYFLLFLVVLQVLDSGLGSGLDPRLVGRGPRSATAATSPASTAATAGLVLFLRLGLSRIG